MKHARHQTLLPQIFDAVIAPKYRICFLYGERGQRGRGAENERKARRARRTLFLQFFFMVSAGRHQGIVSGAKVDEEEGKKGRDGEAFRPRVSCTATSLQLLWMLCVRAPACLPQTGCCC